MTLANRGYTDEDFQSVVKFLCEAFEKTGSYQNWFPDRFENSLVGLDGESRTRDIRLWEEVKDTALRQIKRIVGLVNQEAPSHFFIQIDSTYSFLERDMLFWIEEHFAKKKREQGAKEKLHIHTIEGNSARESLLSELGYQKGKTYGYLRLRPSCLSIPEFAIPEGYEVRPIRGESEYDQLAAVTRLVFGHGEAFNSELYKWIANCSFYRQDLDLVAVAPDGTFASFCTFRMDPVSRVTSLEPMGTHPTHRGKGLAKVLISEGLRCSMKYNPTLFYIGGAADTPAANRLYDSVGFTRKLAEDCWYKEM
jgi:GNAT superfamily N-acetyltransferase